MIVVLGPTSRPILRAFKSFGAEMVVPGVATQARGTVSIIT